MENNKLALAVIKEKDQIAYKIAKCLYFDEQERIAKFIMGVIEENPPINKTTIIDGKECTFVSYNWLKDEVSYIYERKHIRFYRTEEDAKNAEKHKGYYNGVDTEDENHKFKAIINHKHNGYVSLDYWQNSNEE